MANLFFNLPATAGNGSGAVVDVSAFGGPEKTITVQNAFRGGVNIEVSLDGGTTWSTVATFNSTGKKVLKFAADRMRVTRAGVPEIAPGLPDIDVSSNDNGQRFVALPATAGDGSGTAVDVSILGTFNSVAIAGAYRGNVNVEISEDGVTWATCFSFQDGGGFLSKDFTAQFMRVTRSGVPEIAPGLPVVNVGAINDATSGGGGGGGGCLVFRPGSAFTGPTIFNSWADLITKLTNLRVDANGGGCYTIQFDSSIVSPAVIPAGAYAMRDVTWVGGDQGGNAQVTISEGATFTGLRNLRQNLSINNAATATVPITDLANGDIITLHDGCDISTTGTVPFWSSPGILAGQSALLFVDTVSSFGLAASGPVFDFSVAGSFLITFIGEGSAINNGTFTGPIGAFHIPSYASPGASLGLQAGFLGTTFTPFSFAFTRYNINPQPPSAAFTAPAAIDHDQLVRADVSGGGFTLTLPSAAGAFALIHGTRICIKETSSSPGLLIDGAGGDTIDGAGAPLAVLGGGAVVLVSDGISNWIVQSTTVAIIVAPPEKWGLNNVSAGGAAQTLSALVSTQFDTIKAIRPGSVVGLSSRFTEAITDAAADSAIIEVTINGAPGTLQVSSSSGVNPSGGEATQGVGIDTYVAGDLIGVRIRTKGTFLPITTDVESWVQLSENQ